MTRRRRASFEPVPRTYSARSALINLVCMAIAVGAVAWATVLTMGMSS